MTKLNINKALISTITITTVLSCSSIANAGCFSDYCANKKSGNWNRNATLRYGGTYSDAARNSLNYRYGYGTGNNYNFYDINSPGRAGRQGTSRRTATTEDCQQFLHEISRLTNSGAKRIALNVYHQTCN